MLTYEITLCNMNYMLIYGTNYPAILQNPIGHFELQGQPMKQYYAFCSDMSTY